MNSIVDRVAIAISGAPFPSPASRKKAIAAITAMKKPTTKMRLAAANFLGQSVDVDTFFSAMMDAALEDEALSLTSHNSPTEAR